MNIGLIGCGNIGWKRAINVGEAKVFAVNDISMPKALDFAEKLRATYYKDVLVFQDVDDLINSTHVDAVIIATPHNMLAPLTLAAVKAGKHVLVEKPGAIHEVEINEINREARERNLVVQVGYNLRFHPAIMKMRENVHLLGNFMYIRAYYGHGGRTGYEKEWRFDEKQSGGGVLMDLGVHLIDLTRSFFGDVNLTSSMLNTYFWSTDLEDNAAFVLRQMGGQTAALQVSCTEWKNQFYFEIAGTEGKLIVEGLGGSYGPEHLTIYQIEQLGAPPEGLTWTWGGEDDSWKLEFKEFVDHIEHVRNKRRGIFLAHGASLYDAAKVLDIVEQIYDHHKIAT